MLKHLLKEAEENQGRALQNHFDKSQAAWDRVVKYLEIYFKVYKLRRLRSIKNTPFEVKDVLTLCTKVAD